MEAIETRSTPDVGARVPRPSKNDPIDAEAISPSVRYNKTLDTLQVMLFGVDRPSIGVVVGHRMTVRQDPETDQVIGFEIDHFLAEEVVEHPEILSFLDAVDDVPTWRVKWLRFRLDPDARRKVKDAASKNIADWIQGQPRIANGSRTVHA